MLSPIEEVIMDWISAGFLVAVGVVGGVWNAVAGGATLFTFPALMAAGLPPVVANATNYLALLPSNAAALPAYRDELRRMGPALWPLVCVSGAGAAAGSLLLMVSTPSVFLNLVPVLILVATALFAFGEAVRAALLRALGHGRGDRAIRLLLFVASVYGGYFGAGLGIILLAVAQMLGYSRFNQANALKNLLATSFTVISIVLFGVGGLIDWPTAALVMLGSTAGGFAGARIAKRVNERYLRIAVVAFGLVLSAVFACRQYGGALCGA